MKEIVYMLTEEEQRIEDKTINVTDLVANFHKQTEEEQGKTLSFLDSLEKHEKGVARKERLEELPEVVQVLLNLSESEWNRLPDNGREYILEKMYRLREKTRQAPEVEGFSKLSEEKKEAVLESVS